MHELERSVGMSVTAYVESWPHVVPGGPVVYEDRLWGDFTPEGIEELISHERDGAKVYAVDEGGHKTLVPACTVTDPAPEPEPEHRRARVE